MTSNLGELKNIRLTGETGSSLDAGRSLRRFLDVSWSQLADSALRRDFGVLLMRQEYMPTVLKVP
jgi:hypothetical protein